MVGWPPLRRSPVGVCVALHVVANDVATGWLAAAPPCLCCGFACCSMLLLGLCRRRICAAAVVMLSHAFLVPPDPVHLDQSSTRTEAIQSASCAARLVACLQSFVPQRQGATVLSVAVHEAHAPGEEPAASPAATGCDAGFVQGTAANGIWLARCDAPPGQIFSQRSTSATCRSLGPTGPSRRPARTEPANC